MTTFANVDLWEWKEKFDTGHLVIRHMSERQIER